MTSHGIVKALRVSWDTEKSIISQTDQWMRERREAADEIERLRDDLVAIKTDRPYVMGWNEGRDAAINKTHKED